MIFQELSSIPNELIPVFQKEPSSGWPEYNTQSTSKPQSGVKQLDRLVQPTTHVTPSTTFLSAIKISAVQTQATSANSSTTVTSSKKRTKTADTIANKQPRKQFIRETFNPATPLEVNITKTNSTVPNVLANTTTTQSSRPNFLNLHRYTTTPLQDRLQKQHQAEIQAKTLGFNGHPNYDTNLIYQLQPNINRFNLIGYLSNKNSYLLTNHNLQGQTIQVPFDNITANLNPQLDTFTYQVQQNFLTERQRSQQLEQRITELQLEIANLKHQLHILRSSR